MKTGTQIVAWLLAATWIGSATVHAQERGRSGQAAFQKAIEIVPRDSWVHVVTPYAGDPILVIDYPWQTHACPSVEVQWLPEGRPEPLSTRPLTFVDAYMKGDFALDIGRCRDRGERVACNTKVTKFGMDLELNGKRNSLSRPAVWIDCHLTKPDKTTDTRTVFCLLDSWSVDQRTLYLDLPEAYYAQPGRLRVWMMRGPDVVWTHSITWPGMGGSLAAGAKAPHEGKAAASVPPDQKPADEAKAEGAGKAPAEKPGAGAKPTPKPPRPAKEPAAEADNPFD